MKTAISIPDAVFDAAEALAGRLGVSRSELYTRAVRAFLREHREAGVTAELNRIYDAEGSALDPTLDRMQQATLPDEEW